MNDLATLQAVSQAIGRHLDSQTESERYQTVREYEAAAEVRNVVLGMMVDVVQDSATVNINPVDHDDMNTEAATCPKCGATDINDCNTQQHGPLVSMLCFVCGHYEIKSAE